MTLPNKTEIFQGAPEPSHRYVTDNTEDPQKYYFWNTVFPNDTALAKTFNKDNTEDGVEAGCYDCAVTNRRRRATTPFGGWGGQSEYYYCKNSSIDAADTYEGCSGEFFCFDKDNWNKWAYGMDEITVEYQTMRRRSKTNSPNWADNPEKVCGSDGTSGDCLVPVQTDTHDYFLEDNGWNKTFNVIQYAFRDVWYLSGVLDQCTPAMQWYNSTKTPQDGCDPTSDTCPMVWQQNEVDLAAYNQACNYHSVDTRCPAMLQGPWREYRATHYLAYLSKFYGQDTHMLVQWITMQSFNLVPDVGHQGSAMLTSQEGTAAIYTRADQAAVGKDDLGWRRSVKDLPAVLQKATCSGEECIKAGEALMKNARHMPQVPNQVVKLDE